MPAASEGPESEDVTPPGYAAWRRIHLLSSWCLGLLALVHSVLTFRFYSPWSADAVWFLGTGLGLLLLAAINIAHIGIEPCQQPTARLVRWSNWCFVVFGVSAVIAVPQPQAYVILAALFAQAIAAIWTLQE